MHSKDALLAHPLSSNSSPELTAVSGTDMTRSSSLDALAESREERNTESSSGGSLDGELLGKEGLTDVAPPQGAVQEAQRTAVGV